MIPGSSFKFEGLDQLKQMISPRLFNEVLKYTNQDLAKGSKTVIKKKITEKYNIKPSDVTSAMKVKTGSDGIMQILEVKDADSRPLTIFKLAGRVATQNSQGTQAMMRKGSPDFFPQAFIATMPSGHKGVFWRAKGGAGKGGRATRKSGPLTEGGRPKIEEIYFTWITSLVKSDRMFIFVMQWVDENAQRIFEQKLNWKTKGTIDLSSLMIRDIE